MDGPHDLGGAHGLGAINPEPEAQEKLFHHEWEKRAMALTLAAAALGRWNIDMIRHARESQHPVDYLRNSYYENWLVGLETLLVEKGVTTPDELATGISAGPGSESLRASVPGPKRMRELMLQGSSFQREPDAPPLYAPGDRVRAVVNHPSHHTRAPRYIRGREGTVHEHYGAHVFPNDNARGTESARHLYCVRFDAHELWGTDARGPGAVHLDLWEPYLIPMAGSR